MADLRGITLNMDTHYLKSWLTSFEQKQVPYATARALTMTAQDAQAAVRSDIGKKFILKNTFTVKGITFQRAEKKDWPNTFAIIGSRDEYMVKHEAGDTVAPKNKRHAIPVAARPSKSQLVPRKMRMENLPISFKIPQGGRPIGAKTGSRRPPQPFIAITKRGMMGVFIRTGDYIVKTRKERISLLYKLQDAPSKYKARGWFEKVVNETVQQKAQDNYEKAFEEALLSGK